ncbi:hypothetical protein FGO68_gene17713 [Halteria grandinella]|uniref:Uncharacterized protein n=1 Tax=Halteria grandinella TaxID=5974 RepID=A0A8J8T4X2_HALGN|nr:hypothetical protein FGO68_gene17713 [Halteria grandinella]
MRKVILDFNEFMKLSPLQVPGSSTWQGFSSQGYRAIEQCICPYTQAGQVCRFPAQVVPLNSNYPFNFYFYTPELVLPVGGVIT